MINILVKCIKQLLVSKWIFSILLIIPIFSYGQLKKIDLDKINKIHAEEVKEQLEETISKVDEAIYAVIKLPDRERKRFATLITLSCKKYDLDPRIMISILKVESDFNQKAISSTGDYSVAQINFKIWAKNFRKMDRAPLHFERLKQDDAYAIFRMGEILAELQKNHSKHDKMWFARYHSNTPVFKNKYISRLKIHFKKLLPFGPNLIKKLPDYSTLTALN